MTRPARGYCTTWGILNDVVTHNGDGEGGGEYDGFDRIEVDGGPGMPLSLYLHKRDVLRTKLVDSLTPSDKSRAAVAEPQGKGKGKDEGNGATLSTRVKV